MKNKKTIKFGKLVALLFIVMSVNSVSAQNNVGIGTVTPDPSSVLDLSANDKGLLVPRLTSGERLAITNPALGLLVYDIDNAGFFYCQDNSVPGAPVWVSLINKDAAGNVGIGTNTPARTLHVNSVMRLEPIATAPASPGKGDMYFDSTLNKLRVYDGTAWQDCW